MVLKVNQSIDGFFSCNGAFYLHCTAFKLSLTTDIITKHCKDQNMMVFYSNCWIIWSVSNNQFSNKEHCNDNTVYYKKVLPRFSLLVNVHP